MARRKRSVRRAPEAGPRGRGAPVAAVAAERAGGPRPAVVGALVAIGVLVLYVPTAARDLIFGDGPELTGAAVTLGVAHPPGYPVWTVLAHVFTWLPVGTFSFRVSLFSAAAAAICVAIVYRTAYRLSRSQVGALAAAALLALTPVFWRWSVVPEVFALNAALAAALIGLLVAWHANQRPAYFIAAAFVGGIGLAHQQTIGLLGPAVLYLMWVHRRLLGRDRLFVNGTLAFLAGLLPYAYLPLAASRQPAWSWGDIASLGDLGAHVFRTAFGTGQLVSSQMFQGGAVGDRLVAFGASFGAAEALVALVGAVVLYRRERVLFWFTAIAFAMAGPAFVAYSNISLVIPVAQAVLERFFLLGHVVLAPLAAVGIASLGDTVRRRGAEAAIAAAGIALAIAVTALSFHSIDRSDDQTARTFAEDILASTPQGAILLAGGDAIIMPIGYLRTIEGARPDLTYVQIPLLTSDWYVRQIHRQYPDLVLTQPRYDGRTGTSRDLILPNSPDRFAIAGGLLDDSLAATHDLIRRGLVQEPRPRGRPVDASALASLNDRLLASYRVPTVAAVAGRPWEQLILADYAFVAYDVAQVFELQKAYPQAREWYARALAIDPDLVEARAALARLPRAP